MAPSPYIFIISIGPVDMNKYARFDEIPSRTLKNIKETKRYGRTDRRTDGWTDVKTVYPPTNTVCGGYNQTSHLGAVDVGLHCLPRHFSVKRRTAVTSYLFV